MNDLEGAVSPIILNWIKPGRSTFNYTDLSIGADQLEIVKRWLLKTGLCLDEITEKGEIEKFPKRAPYWAFKDKVPDSCNVYAGWVKDPCFALKLTRGYRIFNGGKFRRQQYHRDTFDLSIQLNHLALRMANLHTASWMLMACRNEEGRLCSPQMWSYRWIMPAEMIDDTCLFDSFEDFSKVCVVTTLPVPPIHPAEAEKARISLGRIIP